MTDVTREAVRLYTARSAGELMEVSADTVRRLIRSGRLRGVQVGGDNRLKYRVRADDLQAFIDSQTFDLSQSV